MYEYFPLAKINSVPRDATAFQRYPYPNILNFLRWEENTQENVKWAQTTSRKVMEIVTSGNEELSGGLKINGYGNYGQCFEQILMNCMDESMWFFIVDPEVDGGDGGPVSDKAPVLFGANYPRLQSLKKQYDPEMLFSKWFPIRPASH